MGKEGDLWDDSALVNALNDAVSKYKIMHAKKNWVSLADGEKVTSSSTENVSEVIDEDQNAASHREVEGNGNVASNPESETWGIKNLIPVKETHIANSLECEPGADSSNGLPKQDAVQGLQNSQGNEDYNQLVSQYYELEEKRQKILQQLNQVGGWNYQGAGEGSSSGVQWGTGYASQEHTVPTSQACHPDVVYACCPYVCQSCTSFPACSSCGPCVSETHTEANVAMGPGNSCSTLDGDIVKTAMGAAERAISSMKPKNFFHSGIAEEKEKKKDAEGQMALDVSTETDLSVVLNAWYSAGFYTGKYLTEQSIAKKWHG